jgi:hypothetical protein
MLHPLATYLRELREIRSSGSAVKETSYYGPLANLLNTIGDKLRPRVRCIVNIQDRGAGIPDGGLFTTDQFQRLSGAEPLNAGLIPSRGAIEIKGASYDVDRLSGSEQVARYWERYGQVLVTNYRDFALIGKDEDGKQARLESYRLASGEVEFWEATAQPERAAEEQGERFVEYLKRVMLHAASLAAPTDVAAFLASYARDAKARIEEKARGTGGNLPALSTVRTALEQALGIHFGETKGEHFFRSTLVQTLFYGVFSAWVLWCKKHPPTDTKARFNWREAEWTLHVPMIRALYEEVSKPSRLGPLGLVEVLDWTGAALNRVDRASFFSKFDEGQAVQYFYEPFLEEFDPELRKDFGVWYTPPEVVKYMVARVDSVLRDELGIADGLADPDVYVLDPCCGTGAYLVEVIRRIGETLAEQGQDALAGNDLKRAAITRVFGFEILPAPFVVAHLQLGLLLRNLGAALDDQSDERVGVYLTNALTGWKPPEGPKQRLLSAELEEERDAAERVKQKAPILVILGNPPYDGFADVAIDEERDLSEAYRTTERAPAPQGQGLNNLFSRFFRMAERRIIERTGQGVICYITDYSWLDKPSFTGMRERYLKEFDRIWIDSLNGDKFRTGKRTPDGQSDPSIFSTEWNREGITVGTAVALLVRKENHSEAGQVLFRNLWGREKRAELLATAEQDGRTLYETVEPPLILGLPFMPMESNVQYEQWPKLPELFPAFWPGVKTSRDLDIVTIDRDSLVRRMTAYFDPAMSDAEVKQIAPSLMSVSSTFDGVETRAQLLRRGMESGHLISYCYQPFDLRHVYWHPETRLIDRKREDLFAAAKAGNLFLATRQTAERTDEGVPFFVTRHLADWHMTRPGSMCFPISTNGVPTEAHTLFDQATAPTPHPRANLTDQARAYLAEIGITDPETGGLLWMHTLAVGYSPAYLTQNGDGVRQDWPRIPLPASREALIASAKLGRLVATLLDPEAPAPGVTTKPIRPEMRTIAVVSRVGGGQLGSNPDDLAVTADWGRPGRGGVCMPRQGTIKEREYEPGELDAIREGAEALGLTLEQTFDLLGRSTCDIYLNDVAYWKNVPARVWEFTIGGYQVIKKWLSYRDRSWLGRPLRPDEVRELTHTARRLAALLLLELALDENYKATLGLLFDWNAVRIGS